jgi:hypothetical protein
MNALIEVAASNRGGYFFASFQKKLVLENGRVVTCEFLNPVGIEGSVLCYSSWFQPFTDEQFFDFFVFFEVFLFQFTGDFLKLRFLADIVEHGIIFKVAYEKFWSAGCFFH